MFEGEDIKDAPLCSRDTEALDALVQAGFDPALVEGPDGIATQRLQALLSSLDAPAISADAALTDLTMLRINRAAEAQMREAELNEFDKDALDALIFAGFDPTKVSAALRPRAKRHRELANLTTAAGPVASENLTEQTLARIDAQVQPESFPIGRGRRRVRLGDLISIAALILIGGSLILPVLGALREQRFQSVCQSNMLASAMGLSDYAAANQDSLPMITAGFGSKPWWSVGDPESSNSAHLFHLARAKYVTMEHLACAGNPNAPTRISDDESRDWRHLDEVSYAYRIMSGPSNPNWQIGGRIVVIADRSPVVLRSARGFSIIPSENSPNHDGTGQHALLSDGSALWLNSPELFGGDNIWLPRQVENVIYAIRGARELKGLSGREIPASNHDSFVGP